MLDVYNNAEVIEVLGSLTLVKVAMLLQDYEDKVRQTRHTGTEVALERCVMMRHMRPD